MKMDKFGQSETWFDIVIFLKEDSDELPAHVAPA